ncbi:MAG TPA: hypothetical protein VGX25_29100 [Actinophytocola sp.]|uniref:hypothetical protein n=1 Tax=Actinophytocola sp. TaxID=1872138 RepID=UPI002DDCD28E|nr:hypothetical protein [Actinophytocola sp.]HEV2783462.1 hypothetical protein [Actinophytocola sp.]
MNADAEDVKRLLGRAFGPEPPLRLDRDEVFRRGQRRVRARRIAASGGVAASVIAVMVGAAALSGLGGAEPVVPAASPPPATVATSTFTTGAPPSPSLPVSASPRTFQRGAEPTTDDRAAALTKELTGAGVIPAGFEIIPVPADAKPALVFRHFRGSYHLTADLVDRMGDGSIQVQVSYSWPDEPLPSCAGIQGEPSCYVAERPGARLWVRTDKQPSGYITYRVEAVRADRTRVYVTASNVAARGTDGKPPTRPYPPVEPAVLERIAALPGLSFF